MHFSVRLIEIPLYIKHISEPQAPNVIALLLKKLQNSDRFSDDSVSEQNDEQHTTSKFGVVNTVPCLKRFIKLYLRHHEFVYFLRNLCAWLIKSIA